MPGYDELADHYDETRGGERRGDEYAADVEAWLPPGDGPVLEIGVGTGVVALGLRRRGRVVLGLDVSAPMIRKAKARLGPVVVLSDAMEMALRSGSVAHAISVWVLQAVSEPVRLFREAARVLRPDGRYVVCTTQHPHPEDAIGLIVEEMGARVDAALRMSRPRGISAEDVLGWAAAGGFTGDVHNLERTWRSRPSEELAAIENRVWPALRDLTDSTANEVTRPTVEALRALPDIEYVRRATVDMVVLRRT